MEIGDFVAFAVSLPIFWYIAFIPSMMIKLQGEDFWGDDFAKNRFKFMRLISLVFLILAASSVLILTIGLVEKISMVIIPVGVFYAINSINVISLARLDSFGAKVLVFCAPLFGLSIAHKNAGNGAQQALFIVLGAVQLLTLIAALVGFAAGIMIGQLLSPT